MLGLWERVPSFYHLLATVATSSPEVFLGVGHLLRINFICFNYLLTLPLETC